MALSPPQGQREFVAFYREHFTLVWRTLLRLGVAQMDCDDAAQEVFVAAHRRWCTVKVPGSRRAWLLGIVRRVAWRCRRTDTRHRRRLDAFAAVEHVADDPDTELSRRRAWESLVDFLDSLDEDKREAFVLGELEGLGRHELGAALGINPNTAYSRLTAARRQFFTHFAACDDQACAQLLAHASVATHPDSAAGERGLAALVPLLAPWSATSTLGMWTLGVASALAIAGGVSALAPTNEAVPVATTSLASAHVERPASTEPRSAIVPAAPPVRAEVAARPAPKHVAHTRAPASAAGERAREPESTTEAELEILMAARRAMLAGDHESARRHVAAHRERFGDTGELVRVREEIDRELATLASAPARVRSGIELRR